MAQAVLALGLRFMIVELGKAIPGAAAGWLWQKGIDVISPNDDTDKIRADIKALSDQVKHVQESVDQLAKQLNYVLLELRKDHLNTYANKIIARYDAVNFALQELLNMPKDWTKEQKVKKLEDTRAQIESVLRACVNELPVCLEEMHSLLNAEDSNSILQLARLRSLDNSVDFLSYSCKMKAFVIPFWVAQVKALSLLQMAVDVPSIQYAGGAGAIAKYKTYAEKQEAVFERILGPSVLRLAQAALNLDSRVPSIEIDFKTNNNKWVKPWPVSGVTHMAEADTIHPWILKPTFPLDSIVPSGSYSFELITPKPTEELFATTECSWGGYGACMGFNTNHPSWYIKPGHGDSFTFSFTNSAMPAHKKDTYTTYNGKYLSRQESWWILQSTDALDNSHTRQQFSVELSRIRQRREAEEFINHPVIDIEV